MPLICRFLAHSKDFIATICGNISMLSMSFCIDVKSMSENKTKLYTRKLISVFYRNASLTTLSHSRHINALTRLRCLETREPFN